MMNRLAPGASIAIVAALILCAPVAAQDEGWPGRVQTGIAFIGGIPAGDFDTHIDESIGLDAHLLYRVGPAGNVGVRLDAAWLFHGTDDRDADLVSPVGGIAEYDIRNIHSVTFLGIGPEFSATIGGARPYAGASIGIAYFNTTVTADLENEVDDIDVDMVIHHDDVALAYAAQAGVLIPVTSGRWRISLDFGGRYQRSQDADFITEDGFEVTPGGLLTFDSVNAGANVWILRAGIAVTINPRDRKR